MVVSICCSVANSDCQITTVTMATLCLQKVYLMVISDEAATTNPREGWRCICLHPKRWMKRREDEGRRQRRRSEHNIGLASLIKLVIFSEKKKRFKKKHLKWLSGGGCFYRRHVHHVCQFARKMPRTLIKHSLGYILRFFFGVGISLAHCFHVAAPPSCS